MLANVSIVISWLLLSAGSSLPCSGAKRDGFVPTVACFKFSNAAFSHVANSCYTIPAKRIPYTGVFPGTDSIVSMKIAVPAIFFLAGHQVT